VKKILFIAGTRPEAIKLAPLYLEMRRREAFEPVFCATGQHQDLLAHGLGPFGITPDIDLHSMKPGQALPELTGALFQGIGGAIRKAAPDMIIVQGDTVSAFAGGWCAFYEKIPLAHLEAGLRTGDLDHPFPEEATRRALSIIAKIHFAPTAEARANLVKEGVAGDSIVVTGNTSIDGLYHVLGSSAPPPLPADGHKMILVTGHRRENLGQGLKNICDALLSISQQAPDVEIKYVVHPNPRVRGPVENMLAGRPNISLVQPQGFAEFVRLMADSYFIISDSGGVQEEAPALGRPVLVTRKTTERPEAVATGANRLVGSETDSIVTTAMELLENKQIYGAMARAGCPYGDGRASVRICDWLESWRGWPVA